MSFRTNLLKTIEKIRHLPGSLDIRQYHVFVVVRAWTGDRPGVGSSTITTTELLVSGYPPKVKPLTTKDVIASGGLYTASDLRVGPFTPTTPAGGTDPMTFNPATTSDPTEVTFVVTGPGLPASGIRCERINDDTYGNFSHYLILRQTGAVDA